MIFNHQWRLIAEILAQRQVLIKEKSMHSSFLSGNTRPLLQDILNEFKKFEIKAEKLDLEGNDIYVPYFFTHDLENGRKYNYTRSTLGNAIYLVTKDFLSNHGANLTSLEKGEIFKAYCNLWKKTKSRLDINHTDYAKQYKEFKFGIYVDRYPDDIPMTAGFDLQNADLRCFDEISFMFLSVKLQGANLSKSNLAYAHFENCDLSNIVVWGANFTGSKFINSNLQYVKFKTISLCRVQFIKCDLADTVFEKIDSLNFNDCYMKIPNIYINQADYRKQLHNQELSFISFNYSFYSLIKHFYKQYLQQLPLKRSFFSDTSLSKYYIHLTINEKNQQEYIDLDVNYFKAFLPNHNVSQSCVFLTGEAGIGKTTLTQRLLQEWSNSTWANQYQWVFRISLGYLTEKNYPRKHNDESYTITNIIMQEIFLKMDSSLLMEKYYQELLPALEAQVFDKKVLIILDDFDDFIKVPEYVLNILMKVPQLLVVRRNDNLDDILIYKENQSACKVVFVKGFSNTGMKQYIKNYFDMQSDCMKSWHEKEIMDNLLAFIDDPQCQTLKEICRNPRMLELICLAWLGGLNSRQIFNLRSDKYNSKQIITIFYEQVLLFYLSRYAHDYLLINIDKIDPVSVYTYCEQEITFAERFAMRLMSFKFKLNDGISRYFEEYNLPIKNFSKFNLITSADGEINFNSSANYHFSHASWQYYFYARYLVRILISSMKSREIIKNSEFFCYLWPHETIEEFIREKFKDDIYQPICDFMEGMLSFNKQAFEYFQFWKTGQVPKNKEILKETQLVKVLAQLNYEFDLQRTNDHTLIISYSKSNEGLMSRHGTLINLENRLKIWLHINNLSDQVKLISDENDFILTIQAKMAHVMDEILRWLVKLTNTLDKKPLSYERKRDQSFLFYPKFKQSDSADEEEQVNRISCKLQ